MKGAAGSGPGPGVQDFPAVFVFRDRDAPEVIIGRGWQEGAHADAAASANKPGSAVGGELLPEGRTVCRIRQCCPARQTTLKGSQYLQHSELN